MGDKYRYTALGESVDEIRSYSIPIYEATIHCSIVHSGSACPRKQHHPSWMLFPNYSKSQHGSAKTSNGKVADDLD